MERPARRAAFLRRGNFPDATKVSASQLESTDGSFYATFRLVLPSLSHTNVRIEADDADLGLRWQAEGYVY